MNEGMSDPTDKGVMLVIDEEEEVTQSLKRVFRKKYSIRSATSAEEGLDIMDEVSVHVVISDQRMPGMKGTEFFKEVKDRHPKTVRMILTGYSDLPKIMDPYFSTKARGGGKCPIERNMYDINGNTRNIFGLCVTLVLFHHGSC